MNIDIIFYKLSLTSLKPNVMPNWNTPSHWQGTGVVKEFWSRKWWSLVNSWNAGLLWPWFHCTFHCGRENPSKERSAKLQQGPLGRRNAEPCVKKIFRAPHVGRGPPGFSSWVFCTGWACIWAVQQTGIEPNGRPCGFFFFFLVNFLRGFRASYIVVESA